MFARLNRDTFKIDTLVPAVQTAAILIGNDVLGRLNQHSVSLESAALIGGVSALVSALAQNIFTNAFLRYLSVGVGALAGFAAHRFFFPSTAIDPKVAAIAAAILFAVRFVSDNLRFREPAVSRLPTS